MCMIYDAAHWLVAHVFCHCQQEVLKGWPSPLWDFPAGRTDVRPGSCTLYPQQIPARQGLCLRGAVSEILKHIAPVQITSWNLWTEPVWEPGACFQDIFLRFCSVTALSHCHNFPLMIRTICLDRCRKKLSLVCQEASQALQQISCSRLCLVNNSWLQSACHRKEIPELYLRLSNMLCYICPVVLEAFKTFKQEQRVLFTPQLGGCLHSQGCLKQIYTGCWSSCSGLGPVLNLNKTQNCKRKHLTTHMRQVNTSNWARTTHMQVMQTKAKNSVVPQKTSISWSHQLGLSFLFTLSQLQAPERVWSGIRYILHQALRECTISAFLSIRAKSFAVAPRGNWPFAHASGQRSRSGILVQWYLSSVHSTSGIALQK